MSAPADRRVRAAVLGLVLGVSSGCALAAVPGNGVGPTIGQLESQSVTVQTESAASTNAAASAMENYRAFLRLQNADPKLRAEAMRRLGDLKLESGELERMASEVTRVDTQGAEAIELYTRLLKAYPDYPRNDQVLYQLARAYETTGQSAQALSTLDSIVARYPRSHEYGEVQFRRGELLFSNGRYADAQRAYAAVLVLGRGSGFYAQSLYKHGWSQFKQGLNEDSLGSFADLLDLTLVEPGPGGALRDWNRIGRADRDLVDDSLRVMSITFSYLDGAASIDRFVASRPRMPYAWMLYARLGDLYVDKQRYQDAANTYRAFVNRDPVDEHAPVLSMDAIEAYRKGGFADLVLQGKLEYVQRYGFDAPFWQGRDHAAYPTLVAELKTNLKDVAQYYHASAQKTNKGEEFAEAARWYRAYLQAFPEDPDSASTNYLLADALFESRQYLQAATEYEHTAYNYPTGPRSAEAGYAALVAYQKFEDSTAPGDRAAAHRAAIEAGLKFAQTFPQHPQSAVVLTHVAQDLYTAGDQARAAQSARALLARADGVTSAQQRIAWTIVGQVSFNQTDYAAAEAAFTHALAVAAADDPERADIRDRLADAVYKQGEARRNAGDSAGAAQDFLRVARVAPGSKIIETSQYDAAAALINAQQWPGAIDVLEAFRRDYPKSQYHADVERKLAVAYLSAGRSAQAAGQFEQIADDPKEDPAVVHEALVKAADLYQQSGDGTHSVAMLERLVRDYPTPIPDAIEVRNRLLQAAVQSGDLQRAQYWRHEIVNADATAGAARTDRTRYLAAEAQLALAAPARDAFRAIALVAPLKRTLVAKKDALERAVQAYKAAAEYQVAEVTTAATFETAELYRTLAHDLLASERPAKLSADELEQYNSLLEDQAYPFEEQSIGIHELNAKRAAQGVYDESVRKSFEALAQLLPARYGKTELDSGWIATLAPAAAATPAPGTSPAMSPAMSPATTPPAESAHVAAPTTAAATAPAAPAVAGATVPAPAPVVPSAQAQADFQHATDFDAAGKDTDAELELKAFVLQYPQFAVPEIDLGLLQRREHQLDAAEGSLRHATELEPSNALAWSELGLTLREEGKFSDARAAYQHAIAADANYAPAHRNLAVLLDLYLDDPAGALPEFEQYKALTGEDKPVSTWIAELRVRTGASSHGNGGST